MKKVVFEDKLKLDGFNNLTKCLSFNLYDFCVARNKAERDSYVEYVYKNFCAEKLTPLLESISSMIKARVLAISDQNYDPWGASSMLLLSDLEEDGKNRSHHVSLSGAAHLDKSHITAHTYPDFTEKGTICSIRIDIDIATCGDISPLKALNFLFEHLESDVVVIDYVVRGYTRNENGHRIYMDHEMRSIQDFIDDKILEDYKCFDLNLDSEHIWQTKLLRTNLDESSYFLPKVDLKDASIRQLIELVKKEMRSVLHMKSKTT